jgi:hypothetical protein
MRRAGSENRIAGDWAGWKAGRCIWKRILVVVFKGAAGANRLHSAPVHRNFGVALSNYRHG